ncbi:MAG: hypothetical protein LBT62_08125, partial [Deltaproteobacteria bacterium]|nr:hypothetical protein [Deltaproteobacteria bacterium]
MKIYLETSIFNRYFDVDPILHPATVQLFKEIKAGKFESYTSIFVIRELEEAPIEKNLKMRDIIPKFNIKILFETPKTLDFADLYMENNIISSRYLMDARHIAISVVNNLDKIISLNFKNIVRDKTKFF